MVNGKGETISPGSFLPLAEKYGLIGEIDKWVVRQAIHLAAGGRRFETNLSAESISDPDLLSLIDRELRDEHADPGKVVFDITETALLRNLRSGEAFARGLAEMGCGLALDSVPRSASTASGIWRRSRSATSRSTSISFATFSPIPPTGTSSRRPSS